MLPQSQDLEPQARPPSRVIIHTTGRAFSGALESITVGDALDRYTRRRSPYYGHWLIDPLGGIAPMAPEDRRALHTGSLSRLYAARSWMEYGAPGGAKTWVEHGRDPETVYDWWIARWPGRSGPLGLVPSRHVNGHSIGIDLLPGLDGGYTVAQHGALMVLLQEICARHGLAYGREIILGHEDVDPVRRGTVRGRDGRIYGRGWDPGRLDWGALGL